MPFDYYYRLSRHRQSTYMRSDRIARIRLPATTDLAQDARDLESALSSEDQRAVAKAAGRVADGICDAVDAPRVRLRVLAKRPSDDYEELHGLYEPIEGAKAAVISVWMRTAQRKQVVAFRTFLRTLLHELCHHLDYEHLKLEESFHTEGFYKRESSLFKQIVG